MDSKDDTAEMQKSIEAAYAETEHWRLDPEDVPTNSQEAFVAWTREMFREGPKRRVVALTADQLSALREHLPGRPISIITPFGHVSVSTPEQTRARIDELRAALQP